MSTFFELFTNPAITSLICGGVLGSVATVTIPSWVSDIVATYLIFIIGLKGGACLGVVNECTPPLIMLAIIGAVIGFMQPFLYYVMLPYFSHLDRDTRAVVASQYGSISIVTFITGIAFLADRGIAYDSFMSFVAGIMEIPAIFSGLLLIEYRNAQRKDSMLSSFLSISKNIILCKKINVIFIGFAAGYVLRTIDMPALSSSLMLPFNGALIFFMIDIGIKIARQRSHFSSFNAGLISFGIVVPVISGIVGLIIAPYFSPLQGTALLFALLLASASYIAVPAIMSARVKGAKQAIYLPLALGVTLPFNVLVGIPLFYYLSSMISSYFSGATF